MLDRPADARRARRREQQRRHRARQEAGRACYAVELDGAVINMLVRLRWLAGDDATDKCAVGKAIARMLADAARE
jgi:hypothetical protein